MSWYVIDALDRAIERTRTCLLEPFDIWKWLKLAFIVFFIGGAGSNFRSVGNDGSYDGSFDTTSSDLSWIPQGFIDIMTSIFDQIASYSSWTLVLFALIMIFLFVIIMGLIGSVMEFVLVASLVSNEVRIIDYFRKYLGAGLSLFVLRVAIFILLLLAVAIVALPLFFLLGPGIEWDMSGMRILVFIFLLIVVILVLAVAGGIINSFISMAIPVSMYSGHGIFSALLSVFGQFRNDWKQIVIYWIGRLVLAIATGIIVLILALIGLIVVGLVFLLVDVVLYFGLSTIFSDTVVWLLFIPVLIVEFILFLFSMAFVGMPVSVFMKYHMLTFLEKWYPIEIPVFDAFRIAGGRNTDGWLNE